MLADRAGSGSDRVPADRRLADHQLAAGTGSARLGPGLDLGLGLDQTPGPVRDS